MKKAEHYLKFIAQVVFTALSGLVAALADDKLSELETINVLIMALGAVSVLGAGNLPSGVWAHTKAIVAVATAATVALHTFIVDGIDLGTSQWLQIAIAAAAAAGVYAVKGPEVVPAVGRHGKHEAGY